jgi:hypothetical protein
MNIRDGLISAFMLVSVLLAPYAPTVTTPQVGHSSHSKLGKEKGNVT